MYLLDTDWIIQTLTGHLPATQTVQNVAGGQIFVSIVTIGELYERAFESVHPSAHLMNIRGLLYPFMVLNLSDAIIERFAEIRSYLRRYGQLIPNFDNLIAATALQHNLTLLTFNLRHFQGIPELKLHQPH